MDSSRANLHDTLFSRNSTPPTNPPVQEQIPFSPHLGASNSSPSLIDTLFQNIGPPTAPQSASDQHSIHNQSIDGHSVENYEVGNVASNGPLQNDPVAVVSSPPANTGATDRQNALLSLLGGGPAPTTRSQPPLAQQPPPAQPQQIPTPPGSTTRSNASPQQHTDPHKLLEQIMGGTSSRTTNYSDTQRTNPQAPSPPYSQREEYRTYQHDHSNETSPRARTLQQAPLPPQQQRAPSPRRSMFEFTSAFDHLSSSAGSIKGKKSAPSQAGSVSSAAEDTWNAVIDPKRASVENLLENLTRDQAQQSPPQPPAYEAYLTSSYPQSEPLPAASQRAPLPPIPTQKPPVPIPDVTGSPRGGSPKPLHRPQPRVDVTSNQPLPYSGAGNRRDKESSPGPRGKNGSQKVQQPQGKFSMPPASPGPQSQVIVFDVSQSLDEVQARESVKSTAIALVRQDAVFLPGTTIGATHWVAYAMTRGRVRVISRSSGDRTLLQLPQVFASTSSVIDMAVYGNRLAGVTSDGGFVVWELPEVITDDVPGRILLCVPPAAHDAIRSVKWHPKDRDTLAIASDDKIFVIDLANTHVLPSQPLPHSDLHHIGQVFSVPSTVVAFDFDVTQYSLATISEDSSLTIWNMQDSLPYASHKIYGEDIPSSLTFVDGGIVVGRRNGTVFQLLSGINKTVLSTIKFVNGLHDDPDMFGHISYDARIQTLWVANSRRDSLIALKVHIEPSYIGGEEGAGFIEQVAEFSGIKPTIHFVILTADADPNGDEAHAACVAAKIPPGELALVAFSVHSSGVDQVLIRREWFEHALGSAESKYPYDVPPASQVGQTQGSIIDSGKLQRQPLPPLPAAVTQSQQPITYGPPIAPQLAASQRGRTPPSEEIENDLSEGRGDPRGRGSKNKNVNWKEREKEDSAKESNSGSTSAPSGPKTGAGKVADTAILNESNLGQALTREIRKTEENLHNKIGKLIGKEMDKQHQRFEEARLHEQAEEFARQEKILKLISSELTRNTTRVVEQAVKTEVQQSVLPALENVTRSEVNRVLNDHMNNSMVDMISRGLPGEIEKVLMRPSISNQYTNIIAQNLVPSLERQIKESLSTTFLQFQSQQNANIQQEIMRELRNELNTIKSDLGSWHTEALRSHESTIRDLERTVRSLSDQVKYLSSAPPSAIHHLPQSQGAQSSPAGPLPAALQPNVPPSHLRQGNVPPANPPPQSYNQPLPTFQQPPPPQQQQQPLHQQWYASIAAPQASHPATIPQPTTVPQEKTPPPKVEQWDELYLSVLTSQDVGRLRDLLGRTNPDVVLPLNGPPLVSQAVILTLVHRLSSIIGETSPTDELFKNMLWWLQRLAKLLQPNDKLIADFIPRVIPTAQQTLNQTKQRLAILPGGPGTIDAARQLSDIQEVLRIKTATV